MVATLAQAVEELDDLYPPRLKEDWDAVGLVCGDPAASVRKIAFAVDPTLQATGRALAWGADLMVVHHPLLLRPVSSVAGTGPKGVIVQRMILAGCGLYTAHTNADAAPGGVADALAAGVGLVETRPLVPDPEQPEAGLGRVGSLKAPLQLAQLAQRLADWLPPNRHGVRVAGPKDAAVTTVAVVGGAGDSMFDAVRAAGVDAYVTADLRHHPALEARETAEFAGDGRPYLLDVSHAASEWAWLARAAEELASRLGEPDFPVATWVDPVVADPWTFRVERAES
jgi:dinuclear metal center YbgI/SA1388 family protein